MDVISKKVTEVFDREGFFHEPVYTQNLYCADEAFIMYSARHKDNFRPYGNLAYSTDHIEDIHARHNNIEEHEIVVVAGEHIKTVILRNSTFSAPPILHTVLFEQFADRSFIVNDEDVSISHGLCLFPDRRFQ